MIAASPTVRPCHPSTTPLHDQSQVLQQNTNRHGTETQCRCPSGLSALLSCRCKVLAALAAGSVVVQGKLTVFGMRQKMRDTTLHLFDLQRFTHRLPCSKGRRRAARVGIVIRARIWESWTIPTACLRKNSGGEPVVRLLSLLARHRTIYFREVVNPARLHWSWTIRRGA